MGEVHDRVRAAFRGPKIKPVESPPQLGLEGVKLGVRAINAEGRLALEQLVGDGKGSEKQIDVLAKVIVDCVVYQNGEGWKAPFTDDDLDWIKAECPAAALLELATEAMTFNGFSVSARKEAQQSFEKAPDSSLPSASP